MRDIRFKLLSLFTLALTVALISPLHATADDDDPPSRVARLGYIHGAVSFQPAGTDDWVSAVVNRPMTTGDKLWSDQDSRAELHIGSASIRLANNTGFSFLNLNDEVTQLRLTAGTVRIRVKRLGDNETFEVDTPNLAFSILRPGVYKINVNDEGDATIIKVRGGEGEVTGGGSAYTVHPHEVGIFRGTDQLDGDLESYRNDDDDFDRWCADRDRHEDLSVSARYVSPDVIGYQDLDDYGGWRPVPEYGNVWFPHTTVIGWAPYHYGHWAYVYPWGYTWIDDAPWGFAPFHYGRWVFVGGAWGWVPCPPPAPGVVYVRPVYAPALVAWVGGPHFAVGVGVGGGFASGVSVGWFPLGPREVYVPSYHVSRTYITNVNVTNTTVNTTVVNNYYNNVVVNKNVTVVNQTYVNQRVTGAVTATTPQAFTSAQPVARNAVRVDQREIASAPVNVVTPAVAPPKQAVLGGGAEARVRPPETLQNRAVVAKATPPPPPVSFARQQQAIQANGGQPPAISQVRQMQPPNAAVVHPNVRIAPPAAGVNTRPINPSGQGQVNNGGRFGQGNNNTNQPAANNNPGQPGANGNAGNDGYRRFNDRPGSSQPNTVNNPSGQNQNTGRMMQGNNAAQTPGAGNTGNREAGNRQFNDRPSSSQPSNQNQNTGRTMQGNNAAQTPGAENTGNPGAGNRQFNDRPSSSQPSNQNQNTGRSMQGNNAAQTSDAGNAGNREAGNRQFNDRPSSSQPSNQNQNTGRTMQGNNAAQTPGVGNAGNPGAGNRQFNDHPSSSQSTSVSGGNTTSTSTIDTRHQQQDWQRPAQQNASEQRQQQVNQRHEQPPQNVEQKHDNPQQQHQQKQQETKKQESKSSKDDASDHKK